jgi:transcriptional regulator with XRE-family HTH domain
MSPSVWRIRRKILGLRQRDVADRAEMSQSRYSLLERGEAIPTAKESEAIDRVLELPDDLRKEVCRATAQPAT